MGAAPIYYRIPPCNPWGGSPSWWLLPLNGTGLLASYGAGGGLVDDTSRFTAGAQALIGSLNGQGSTSDLVLNDGVRIISTRGMVGAVVTRSGTTLQVNGALVASGNQIASVGTSDGASTPTVANFVSYTMDVEREMLHVLTRDPGSGAQALQSVNLRQTLHGVAGTSHALTGSTFATPLSLQYNNQKVALYLLDRLDSAGNSALRLLSIGLDGTTQVLWTTVAVASANFPTQAFLSADSSGGLTVSVTVPGGAAAEVMTVDGTGAPLRSFDGTTAIASSVIAEPNGSLWIVGKMTQPGTSNWALNPARYDVTQLLPSICAASWLRSVAGSTGLLATAVAGCAPLTNGGFETGDFQWWTPSGASETISTTAHTGKYSALLGLSTPTNGDSTVKQTITVPSSGGTLTLWYSTTCPDTVQYDWFTASLQSTLGATLATVVSKTCVASSGWTSATYNLSAYANQTIVVVMTNHDDNYSSDPTYTLVDDVSVQ